MLETPDLELLMNDIDKIVSGQTPVANDQCAKEYKELLSMAQMLATADYATPDSMQRVWEKINKKSAGEIDDEDLDMVAGGLNLQVLEEKNKKNGK